MSASFDIAAKNYDATFTNSVIGKAQRHLVYHHFSEILKTNTPKTILEINCGTGEDALWLAKQKFQVVATDISKEMIAIAKSKNTFENCTFEVEDATSISEKYQVDLLFSNFGGLNCLTPIELERFFKTISKNLTSNGRLVLIIMPKNTLWEQLYFLFKANISNAFRRKKGIATANVDGENVPTNYYNPKEIVHLSKTDFDLKALKPIGFFIPPSYMEPFFKNKPKLFSCFNWLEDRITHLSFLSKYADHYLICLQKK